jgi:hypothetical protein
VADLDPRFTDDVTDLPRRPANLMSPRMRETRNFFTLPASSRSAPTTYQTPKSVSSAYGLSVRSFSLLRAIEKYGNLTVRCFEMAPSSLPSRPGISGE